MSCRGKFVERQPRLVGDSARDFTAIRGTIATASDGTGMPEGQVACVGEFVGDVLEGKQAPQDRVDKAFRGTLRVALPVVMSSVLADR